MTLTIQAVQANINDLLHDMDAGTQATVPIINAAGGAVIGKLMKWSTFAAADVAGARDLQYVPQLQLAAGPMTNPGTDGLYKLTKIVHDAFNVPDGTVHSSYQYTNGAGGVLYTAVPAGTAGNAITVTHVVAGLNTAFSVVVVGPAITVNLATDGAGAATTTMAQLASGVLASAAASALVTALATGVVATVAGALGVTSLAGAAAQPAGVQKFQAFPIFRKHVHSTNALVAPTVPARAILVSSAHAAFIGL